MIKIYSTLSKELEVFDPMVEGEVSMYVCGPTVYDRGHLGHGRSMVAFDLIRRYFLYKGYKVKFITNYTDIDDKMITRAAEEGITVEELAERIIPMYNEDFGRLHIMPPTNRPKPTDYVLGVMEMTKHLLAEKSAYKLKDGVYFNVKKFKEYGKLSGQNLDELQHGARVEVNTKKKNPSDFVLWKNKKEGEPSWTDGDGILEEGRPGWHIECSVMARELLGDTIDIHGGGMDLTFPHHECEIAVSECANNAPFARYWMHNGYVNIDGEKMSKSLNNFKTLHDIFEVYNPNTVRYLLIATHYRMPIDFTEEVLQQAKSSLERLQNFYDRVKNAETEGEEITLMDVLETAVADFETAMNNDFEISSALAAIFDLVRDVNTLMDQRRISSLDKDAVLSVMEKFDTVLSVLNYDEVEIDKEVEALIAERDEARANKNWKRSDEIRDELLDKGIHLEDTPDGTKWKKAS